MFVSRFDDRCAPRASQTSSPKIVNKWEEVVVCCCSNGAKAMKSTLAALQPISSQRKSNNCGAKIESFPTKQPLIRLLSVGEIVGSFISSCWPRWMTTKAMRVNWSTWFALDLHKHWRDRLVKKLLWAEQPQLDSVSIVQKSSRHARFHQSQTVTGQECCGRKWIGAYLRKLNNLRQI